MIVEDSPGTSRLKSGEKRRRPLIRATGLQIVLANCLECTGSSSGLASIPPDWVCFNASGLGVEGLL